VFSPADFADEGADKYADRASSKFMLLEIYHYFIVCLLILELDQFNTSEFKEHKICDFICVFICAICGRKITLDYFR